MASDSTIDTPDADRVYLFDTTLRDGQQTRGVDFTVADKAAIARALDQLGIDYIEGGWPGANPTDDRFFAEPPKMENARIVAFGMTRRPGRSAENDPGLAGILDARVPAVCLVGKTWDFHVDVALEIERDENVAMVRDSIARAVTVGREAMFDCEHFFDGFKANPDYALECAEAAYKSGARWVVLCDTNGGTLPHEIEAIVATVAARVPGTHLGIHCHNDTGNAVANSLAAIRAGARQVQGTINGLGERCGNADMMAIIPNLVVKMGMTTNVGADKLTQLTSVSRMLDERLNRSSDPHRAYVGAAAFAHKGGLHVSAVQKDPKTYEHVEPGIVGNQRHILVSDQAGRSNILARFAEIGVEIDPKHPKIQRLVDEVKEKEFLGYSYDSAEASFELLARRLIQGVPEFFTIERWRVMDERRFNARGDLVIESEATATLTVGGTAHHEVAVGNGPVNALDTAIRKALTPKFPAIQTMRLIDYKVRILPPARDGDGTDATTRVMIESEDETGTTWRTVGVSPNIIDASIAALSDAITWKLLRAGAAVPKTDA
ncbi:citramalate synthase [Thalassobaculum litoreum]|uniref:Citramalate synthase n=1 Tax=Thalassobaculum litoreum DSM 18839 TaxID=1123362 RepID=A0A8G2EWW1_9PROT|nr:citramalate synthase [Thalassobaculum litoreum]SDG45744.1 2-isopropylmalate synthase [Thalassobaculum litoreum DSM 18839]